MRFSRLRWSRLIKGLRRRGRGEVEAGAFLLAAREGDLRVVQRIVYYDDLDPGCLVGSIRIDGLRFGDLWELCARKGLVVIGDIHTHPSGHVEQSPIDQANPMLARSGHLALIVPHFAERAVRPADIGLHRYEGASAWTTWIGSEAERLLYVGWRP